MYATAFSQSSAPPPAPIRLPTPASLPPFPPPAYRKIPGSASAAAPTCASSTSSNAVSGPLLSVLLSPLSSGPIHAGGASLYYPDTSFQFISVTSNPPPLRQSYPRRLLEERPCPRPVRTPSGAHCHRRHLLFHDLMQTAAGVVCPPPRPHPPPPSSLLPTCPSPPPHTRLHSSVSCL